MASNPVTPAPKSNGNELHDPFTDEKKGDNSSAATKEESKENGKGEQDGEGSGEETPTLFYAYARRSDNHWSSRYLITFSSADICKEWWSLVQSEYPNEGTRHGPQFFSFNGDDFLKKPATSKKFEHLKTQWFYSQFGDASGTGGRTQDIIPLQDWDGRIIRGSEDAGKKLDNNSKKGKGKATATATATEDDDNEQTKIAGGGIDFTALTESLHTAASVAELNNAQVSQLTEAHLHAQEQSQHSTDRLQRIEALVEENAQQLQSLAKSHVKAQQQNRELAEQNARVLRELKRQRAQAQTLLEQMTAAGGNSGEKYDGREKEAGEIEGVHVVVHPPPRKIDRQLVGYAYHFGGGDIGAVAGAKESPAKGANAAKRPGVGNRTASSAGPKAAAGK